MKTAHQACDPTTVISLQSYQRDFYPRVFTLTDHLPQQAVPVAVLKTFMRRGLAVDKGMTLNRKTFLITGTKRCEPWKGRMARWRVVRGSRRFSAERSECKKIFMPA